MPISQSGRTSVRRVTTNAALLAAALMLSYLEQLVPLSSVPIPGFKPGLANMVTVMAFALLSAPDALVISLLRVGIVGVLFGSWTSLFFSFCGAATAFLSLLASRLCLRRCSYFGVSVFCAAAHNVGQVLAATVLFGPTVPLSYLPWLLPMAILTGALTGTLLNLAVPRVGRWFSA